MKIVRTDNYARETVPEYLVAENIKSEQEAKIMVKALRDTCSEDNPNWYKLVADDYELWRGMAEFE